jgi:hypothetical protein
MPAAALGIRNILTDRIYSTYFISKSAIPAYYAFVSKIFYFFLLFLKTIKTIFV